MSRDYINSARLEQLADAISPKELAVLVTLQQVRLASGAQLERLHFVGQSTRNRQSVLQSMAERGLITRLERTIGGRRSGSAGYLYALGVAGRRLVDRKYGARVRRPSTPGAPFVAHALAVTELIVRLRETERPGGLAVLEVQTEPQCWRRHPGPGGGTEICKPDAYIRLGVGEFEDSWMLELDTGSESPATLARKLDAYRRYFASGIEQSWRGVFPRILWVVPDLRRHQVVVDACSRQPADAWRLHLVTVFEDAVGLMTGDAS